MVLAKYGDEFLACWVAKLWSIVGVVSNYMLIGRLRTLSGSLLRIVRQFFFAPYF